MLKSMTSNHPTELTNQTKPNITERGQQKVSHASQLIDLHEFFTVFSFKKKK